MLLFHVDLMAARSDRVLLHLRWRHGAARRLGERLAGEPRRQHVLACRELVLHMLPRSAVWMNHTGPGGATVRT